jgi:hypothetical protein
MLDRSAVVVAVDVNLLLGVEPRTTVRSNPGS